MSVRLIPIKTDCAVILRPSFPRRPEQSERLQEGKQLHTRRRRLLRHGNTGITERVVQGNGDWFVRVQGHGFFTIDHHLPADREKPAITLFSTAPCKLVTSRIHGAF